MSLTYGPQVFDQIAPKNASDVTVTRFDGEEFNFSSPIVVSKNTVGFTVDKPGRYEIRVKTVLGEQKVTVDLNSNNYDPIVIREYVDYRLGEVGTVPGQVATALADSATVQAGVQAAITAKTAIMTLAQPESWFPAWQTQNINTLRSWFVSNSGPRMALNPTPLTGEIIISSQSNADALVGRKINGHIIVNAPNLELRDFLLMGDGHPILIDHRTGANNLHIHNVEVSAQQNPGTVRCISGPATGHNIHHNNLHDATDGISARAGSTYRYNWIHTPLSWPGVYVPETDPHNDGIQIVGGTNIVIERNFIDITPAKNANIISCILVKSDDAAISNVSIKENFLDGGGRTVHVLAGAFGNPTAVSILDNRMGENFNFGLWNIGAGITVTRTGNIWATTLKAVPLDASIFTDATPFSPRNITSLAVAGKVTSGEIRIARVGDMVDVRLKSLIPAVVGTIDPVITLPLGYRPLMEVNTRIINQSAGARTMNIFRDGRLALYAVTATDNFNVSVTFMTKDAWPDTLPGSTVYTAS